MTTIESLFTGNDSDRFDMRLELQYRRCFTTNGRTQVLELLVLCNIIMIENYIDRIPARFGIDALSFSQVSLNGTDPSRPL
jgi:hypothetical protein